MAHKRWGKMPNRGGAGRDDRAYFRDIRSGLGGKHF